MTATPRTERVPAATRATHAARPPVAVRSATPPLAVLAQRARRGPGALGPAGVLALQRSVGNRATLRLIHGGAPGLPVQRAWAPALVTREELVRAPGDFGARPRRGTPARVALRGGSPVQADDDKAQWREWGQSTWVPIKTTAGVTGFFNKAHLGFNGSAEKTGGAEAGKGASEALGSMSDISGGNVYMGITAFAPDSGSSADWSIQQSGMFGGAASGAAGLIDIVGIVHGILTQGRKWWNLENGLGFVEAGGKLVAGAGMLMSAGTRYAGDAKDKVAQGDSLSYAGGVVMEMIGGIKDVIMSIVSAIKAYKAHKAKSHSEAAEHGSAAFLALVSAAGNAAKAARDVYQAMAQAVPPALMATVPALSMLLSALNIVMRFPKALSTGGKRKKMEGKSKELRPRLGRLFGLDVENKEERDHLFDKDRRGTFPAYETYFRVKKPIQEAFDAAFTSSGAGHNPVLTLNARLSGTPAWTKLLAGFGAQRAPNATVLRHIYMLIREYELADKMGEINKKRQVGGWTEMALELVNIGGDIAILVGGAAMGIGAAVGQGMKGAVTAVKLTHGGSKLAQKLYRDRSKEGTHHKSSSAKHKEYVRHTRFIYEQMGETVKRPNGLQKEAEAKKIAGYIKAAGLDIGVFKGLWKKPDKQVEALVNAMKQRG